jgi:hypothetical protein
MLELGNVIKSFFGDLKVKKCTYTSNLSSNIIRVIFFKMVIEFSIFCKVV